MSARDPGSSGHAALSRAQTNLIVLKNRLWPADTDVLRVKFLSGTPTEKAIVKLVVDRSYNTLPMRIQFRFIEDDAPDPSDIRIDIGKQLPSSYIGSEAQNFPGGATMWLNFYPHIPDSHQKLASVLTSFCTSLATPWEWNTSTRIRIVLSSLISLLLRPSKIRFRRAWTMKRSTIPSLGCLPMTLHPLCIMKSYHGKH